MYYYGYRYLDPAAGRWMSRDPIGEKGGFNLFEFATNSPTFIFDLLGLNAKEFHLEFTINKTDALWTRAMEGIIGTAKSVSSLKEISDIISALTGSDCDTKCVKTLTIWAHGDPGMIHVGNGMSIDSAIFDTYKNHIKWLKSKPKPSVVKEQERIYQDQLSLMKTLESIRGRLCKNPQVIINSCNAGFGPSGKALEGKLAEFFGFSIDLPGAYCSPSYIVGIKYTNEIGTIFDGPSTDREGIPLDKNKPINNDRCCKKKNVIR